MKRQWIAFSTLSRRELTRIFRIWTQTILPSPISMILYFVIFGSLIGQRVGLLDGVPYVTYIAPGLIMMAIINNSYTNIVGSFFGAKFARNIEEMYVSTMSPITILLGFMAGSLVRAFTVALIVTGIAMFFTHIQIHSWAITLAGAFLTAVLFSLAGIINALFAKKFDDINIIPTFILTPLTYVGGVFFSVNMLSGIWYDIAHLNPMLYIVNVFRYGMIGITDIEVGQAFASIGLFITIMFVIAYRLLKVGYGVRT